MRVGIIALLHESNTFAAQPTELLDFQQNLLLTGETIREALADSHHEVGGFFEGLRQESVEAVPIFAARALPSGTISAAAFETLIDELLKTLRAALPLDGLLVAPHGATVSEQHPDADGYWLQRVRAEVGVDLPIVATLDAHANLSRAMVSQCQAIIAYRTNPHLDQRARGIEAARLVVRCVQGDRQPTMTAVFPPMAISIDRQCTDEPHLKPLYDLADQQLNHPEVLSNSILLGFPYADVSEMGSSVLVVTDGNPSLATRLAGELAEQLWSRRRDLAGEFTSVAQALEACAEAPGPVCLLDMGDNVGGGSAADGTELLRGICDAQTGPAFACLFDPGAVEACDAAGIGNELSLEVGGNTDSLHGAPLALRLTVKSLHDGKFHESKPRHGGIMEFDQGRTAVCTSQNGLTLMLTSHRMVPFSLEQLRSCGVDPADFRLIVAKGVNAPIAAYRDVCHQFIRVNTSGSTCAEMRRLPYRRRTRSMFPSEENLQWSFDPGRDTDLAHGFPTRANGTDGLPAGD